MGQNTVIVARCTMRMQGGIGAMVRGLQGRDEVVSVDLQDKGINHLAALRALLMRIGVEAATCDAYDVSSIQFAVEEVPETVHAKLPVG